jgi:rRNA maturation RNase YbeY
MAIRYEALDNVSFPPSIKRRRTTRWIKQVIARYSKRVGDIVYVFCSDDEILRINKQYLQHDYYTDIITFDYSEGDVLSGDLFISLDTVRSNAERYKTHCGEELRRVMVHGILHLCGLNDKSPSDAGEMRLSEDEALSRYQDEV